VNALTPPGQAHRPNYQGELLGSAQGQNQAWDSQEFSFVGVPGLATPASEGNRPMNRSNFKPDTKSPVRAPRFITRKRLPLGIAALFLASGSIFAGSSASANAATVFNMMLCDPGTGWCYQTNPPYVPGIAHWCQWDSNVQNLHSGMWYTGCQYWGPKIG